MTKKYYCDFCDVRVQNNPLIIKKHNEGLYHQQNKAEHYNQFKNYSEILLEEKNKSFCSRFLGERCNFGAICRFSHYTPQQLQYMKSEVARMEQERKSVTKIVKTVDDFLEERSQKQAVDEDLPPSLREKSSFEAEGVDWG